MRKLQIVTGTVFISLFFLVCTFPPVDPLALDVFEGAPRINDPTVVGNYPRSPFLFPVPTSGQRPLTWTAQGLPAGLALDAASGIISGSVNTPGRYPVAITATNSLGEATRTLTIEIGDQLALTPPMGWNSWNTFGQELSEELLLQTADSMISLGLRDLGYRYVNIDDYWQLGERGEDGHLQVNQEKFPNGIRYVADYLHERGLQLGIYSDAAELTCGDVAGSYGYEATDAQDFADWGVDLLKYDYCHAPDDQATAIERYTTMGKALRATGRSFIYSVCEWGLRDPWTWADSVGGHYWRTTWDIRDKWYSENYNNLENGLLNALDINAPLAKYAGPGGWNDPDMLVVGLKGESHSINHDSVESNYGLNAEQYRSHMSMWCMLAAPLLLGNDVRTMDDETKETLMNPEIISINQDRLGQQARRVMDTGNYEVWTKPLTEDRVAVACLNTGSEEQTVTLDLTALTLPASATVRDVWTHQDLGEVEGELVTTLAPYATHVFVLQ